jgi:hypothetical protein
MDLEGSSLAIRLHGLFVTWAIELRAIFPLVIGLGMVSVEILEYEAIKLRVFKASGLY